MRKAVLISGALSANVSGLTARKHSPPPPGGGLLSWSGFRSDPSPEVRPQAIQLTPGASASGTLADSGDTSGRVRFWYPSAYV